MFLLLTRATTSRPGLLHAVSEISTAAAARAASVVLGIRSIAGTFYGFVAGGAALVLSAGCGAFAGCAGGAWPASRKSRSSMARSCSGGTAPSVLVPLMNMVGVAL